MKKRMNFLGLLLVFLTILSVFLAGCECKEWIAEKMNKDGGDDDPEPIEAKYPSRIIGMVKAAGGNPIIGAAIALKADLFLLDTVSNGDGSFSGDVEIGAGSDWGGTHAAITVSKSGYKTYSFNMDMLIGRQYNVIVTLAETGSAEEGSWILGPGNISVSGSVESSEGGPIEGATIELMEEAKNGFTIKATSDSAGNFSGDAGTIGICQPTKCRLWIEKEGFVGNIYGKEITINPGTNSLGKFTLISPNVHLVGNVKSSAGQAISSAQLLMICNSGALCSGFVSTPVNSDADGSFSLSGLTSQTVEIKLSATRLGYYNYTKNMVINPGETYQLGTIFLEIDPSENVHISGSVKTSGGTGIAGVTVNSYDLYFSTLTDENGHFEIWEPFSGPSRNIRIYVHKDGYESYSETLTVSGGGDYTVNAVIDPI